MKSEILAIVLATVPLSVMIQSVLEFYFRDKLDSLDDLKKTDVLKGLIISFSPLITLPFLLNAVTFHTAEKFVWFIWLYSIINVIVSLKIIIGKFIDISLSQKWLWLMLPFLLSIIWTALSFIFIVLSFSIWRNHGFYVILISVWTNVVFLYSVWDILKHSPIFKTIFLLRILASSWSFEMRNWRLVSVWIFFRFWMSF